MPRRTVTMHDVAVLADNTRNPTGEAPDPRDIMPRMPMTPTDRKDMVQRLQATVIKLMEKAEGIYNANCHKMGSTEVNPDYVTRLSTNEFFFYTNDSPSESPHAG